MHQRLFLLLAIVFLTGCDSFPIATTAARSGSSSGTRFAENSNERPGLGTKWGEDRTSRADWQHFERANSSFPAVNAAIRYDDLDGIHAMIGHTTLKNRAIDLPTYGGSKLVSVGLQNDHGNYLPIANVNGRIYVVGETGRRYQIVVRNNSEDRIEAVLSVDGLDVLDGHRASFKKAGYIVRPHGRLVVDGFRQSMDKVAAFRFGSVRESYAHEKYRNSSNVGVIGIAVFGERGTNDPRREKEAKRRLNAQPFATPVY